MSRSWSSGSMFVVAAVVAAVGCEPDPPEPSEGEGEGEPCFFGDPAQAPEGELVWRTLDGRMEVFAEGQQLPLILPPQGGKVVMVGARVRNMGCTLALRAGAFDDCKGVFLGVDGRPLQLEWNEATGWAEPAFPDTLNNYGNVAMCFNNNSGRDTNDEEYRFEVRVTDVDDDSRALVLSGRATPVCAEPDFADECDCECDVEFSFERSCDEVRVDPDVPPGTCLEGGGEGEGAGEGEGEGEDEGEGERGSEGEGERGSEGEGERGG